MKTLTQDPVSKTIARTLRTAKLIDTFWERWLVHGLDKEDLEKVRPNFATINDWYQSWKSLAHKQEITARILEMEGHYKEAEYTYRQTALYYNLNYWIDPNQSESKQFWYKKCLANICKADSLSNIKTIYHSISIGDKCCAGRVRIPDNAQGCILIINPIDSAKEELFKYEMEFVEKGYITLSFDGPGQGETFLYNGVIGTRELWEKFMEQLIQYASSSFPGLPINLFGTSLGASWVLYGSSNEKVAKAVAVSPAIELEKMNMPTYFLERMKCSCIVDVKEQRAIPKFEDINYSSPVLLFHGKKDMMVPDDKMHILFNNISCDKRLIEYEDEGHVCNNRLDEIRDLSVKWFSGNFALGEKSI